MTAATVGQPDRP